MSWWIEFRQFVFVDERRRPCFADVGRVSDGFYAAKVFRYVVRVLADLFRRVLLEEPLERVDVVELYARDASDVTFVHGAVLAKVEVLDIVELGIR